jgi:hypothetical protein
MMFTVVIHLLYNRLCYYSMDSLYIKQRFLGEIRTTFGFGGLNCSLADRDLSDFHNFLEKDFPFHEPGRTRLGATCVGRQFKRDGLELAGIWVLNPELHIDTEGNQVNTELSEYVWQPVGGPCIENSYSKNNHYKVDIRSTICLPLESHESLNNLLMKMKPVLKHNFIAGIYGSSFYNH